MPGKPSPFVVGAGTEDGTRSRLISIHQDSTEFLKETLDFFQTQHFNNADIENVDASAEETFKDRWPVPVVANERCGSVRIPLFNGLLNLLNHFSYTHVSHILALHRFHQWYTYPYPAATAANSAHFKSTDGHKNVYNFSLKRLNLAFLETVANASHKGHGTVLIVDASKYKIQPDSFSTTLPIWCAVMNRLVVYYRNQVLNETRSDKWDDEETMTLFTPPCISQECHEQIINVIDERVRAVIDSKVILDPKSFVRNAPLRPMRCFWFQNNAQHNNGAELNQLYNEIEEEKSVYSCIVCISCSDTLRGKNYDQYISGAGDDEESWSRGLTPSLFWENVDGIIHETNCDEETNQVITSIVETAKQVDEEWFRAELGRNGLRSNTKPRPCFTSYFDTIGLSSEGSISIGTRRAGRPPDCWEHFDAVVNATTMEYDEISSANTALPEGKYYLQLPVQEGKRDKSELENWMAVAMLFIGVNLKEKRRILIHCAQGMDRSVAVAMAALCLYHQILSDIDTSCSPLYSWCARNMSYASFQTFIDKLDSHTVEMNENIGGETYLYSGIPIEQAQLCKGKEGRDIFLSYLKSISSNEDASKCDQNKEFFATKDTLRLALMKVQQYRAKACPTRSTMQKLNRFFMSSAHEK